MVFLHQLTRFEDDQMETFSDQISIVLVLLCYNIEITIRNVPISKMLQEIYRTVISEM